MNFISFRFSYLWILAAFLLFGCNKVIKKEYLKSLKVVPTEYENTVRACRDQLNYIPDSNHIDHTPIKYVKVNFHVVCNSEGEGNFDEKTGRVFINEVYDAMNDKLGRNKKMNLPPGNNTPVLPMRYRLQLTGQPDQPDDDGIYFHNDDDFYWIVAKGKDKNFYSKDVFHKYGIQKDSVLNVFILADPIDSLDSPTYKASSRGIGYPEFIKMTYWYLGTRDSIYKKGRFRPKFNKWHAVKSFAHELGHTLGLRHTWRGNDGCDDTPHHSNCWNRTKGKAPCDEWWSNNFMDYNAHNSAWSPCQIGTIHRNMSDKKKRVRKFLARNWCTLDESKTINIRDQVEWPGAKDLEGNLIVLDGGQLTVRCRMSLPEGAKIIVHPKGRLILDAAKLENDCGGTWKGIEVWTDKEGNQGAVQLINNASLEHMENPIELTE